jgi:hemoglobin-like flavoprotein
MKNVLRETLELTLARDDSFPQKFYDSLFAAHPDVRPLFHRSSPGAQNKMFAQKLTAIVDHIDDPAWLGRELSTLAAKHVGYGVRPEMYQWVGDALLVTLAAACADAWTPEAESAWRSAYSSLVDAILGATRERLARIYYGV